MGGTGFCVVVLGSATGADGAEEAVLEEKEEEEMRADAVVAAVADAIRRWLTHGLIVVN